MVKVLLVLIVLEIRIEHLGVLMYLLVVSRLYPCLFCVMHIVFSENLFVALW